MLDAASHPKPTNLDKKLSFSLSWTNANRSAEPVDLGSPALIKKNRPISDVKWLNQLDRAKGIDHRTTYDNTTAATRFIEFISTTEVQ
jgi:hypothetical protein